MSDSNYYKLKWCISTLKLIKIYIKNLKTIESEESRKIIKDLSSISKEIEAFIEMNKMMDQYINIKNN